MYCTHRATVLKNFFRYFDHPFVNRILQANSKYTMMKEIIFKGMVKAVLRKRMRCLDFSTGWVNHFHRNGILQATPKKNSICLTTLSCNWTIYAGDIFGFQEYGKLSCEHPRRSSRTSSSSEDSITSAVAPKLSGVTGVTSNQSWVADFIKL